MFIVMRRGGPLIIFLCNVRLLKESGTSFSVAWDTPVDVKEACNTLKALHSNKICGDGKTNPTTRNDLLSNCFLVFPG